MLTPRTVIEGTILVLVFVGLNVAGPACAQEPERTVLTRQRRVTGTTQPENSGSPAGRVYLNGVLISGNPPQSRMVTGRRIFVASRSKFLNVSELEDKLRRDARFSALGLEITRSLDCADLILDVDRTPFTTNFNYAIVDASKKSVLSNGHANSLFGTASGKIAGQVLEKLSSARAVGP